jgi:glycosyltransferase involved in cell wall biosynthesis
MTALPTDGIPGGTPVSACIICFEEADRIADCVKSVDFCEQIVVVDSGSSDGTREIARALGAEVHVNAPFPGHREQKQRAVELARHDMVLCLDADERVTPELRACLLQLKARGLGAAAYSMPRRNHYLGRVVRHGLFWPDRKVRLFDRRFGRWGGTNPHDRVELAPGIEPRELGAPLEHLSFRDFGHHRRTLDSYTAIAARALFDAGRRCNVFDLLVRPPAVMLKSLLLKRGFLDGWRGFVIAGMAFHYDWLKYWRLRGLWKQRGAS